MDAQPDNLLPLFPMEKKSKSFNPPNIDDCIAYGKVIGLSGAESMTFFDRQEMIGWLVAVGRTTVPMKDWQAAMRTWKRNNDKWNPPQSGQAGQFRQPPRPPAPVPVFAQIQSLNELISKSPANPQSARYNDRCSAEEKEKLKTWRTTLRGLHEQQARGGQK
jgi:hypothetical protein